MSEQPAEHTADPSVPNTFIRGVGWAIRCVCGRDYVAGYPCEGDPRYQPGGEFAEWRNR